MRAIKYLALLACCGALDCQTNLNLLGVGATVTAAASTITLDGTAHCSTDNNTTSATTVVCGPITPTAGDVISCEWSISNGSTLTKIADNVNTGNYNAAQSVVNDFNTYQTGVNYLENVAASATTITLTYTTAAQQGKMACQAWKGTPATYTLDSSVFANQTTTTTNPVTGTNQTPFANNYLVLASLRNVSVVTPTAGTNYTLTDQVARLYPEYWIQTTATATQGPYTSSSSAYTDSVVAFANNTSGFCDSTAIMDWTGSSDTTTVTTALLQASTKGAHAQPNSSAANGPPGWILTGAATGFTYSTGAAQAFATTLACPFYAGTGTTTLGLNYSTTQAAHSATMVFDTASTVVTAATCFQHDMAETDLNGSNDVFTVTAGSDFSNAVIVGNGTNLFWDLETGASTAGSRTINAHPNTQYWIEMKYTQSASAHNQQIRVFNGCGASPTLLGTITNGGNAGDPIAFGVLIGSAGAKTTTTGKNWKYGNTKVDYIHGGALLP